MKAYLFLPVVFLLLFSCQPDKKTSETAHAESVQTATVKTIGAVEFKSLSSQENAIILDVRTPEEVADGKIPNAQMINIYDPEFESKVIQLQKEKSVFIYCSAGVRSAKAAEFLISQGYPSVYHLQGGLGEWLQNGFPFQKD